METKSRKSYTKSVEIDDSHSGMSRRSDVNFKPVVSNRATVVSRSSSTNFPTSMRFESQSRHSFAGIPSQQMTEFSSAGVSNFKEERTHEKAEMKDLNSRLANYMENMRYFEAANKALEKELEKLKKIKDVDFDKIKSMYEEELNQSRKVLNETAREKAEADVKVLSLEDEVASIKHALEQEIKFKEDYHHKAEKLADQIGEYEGEISSLRQRVDSSEDTIAKLQETIKRLQNENGRLRSDLDTETIAHINESNRAQGVEEELAFITQVYEQEIKELQDLARRDTTIEMREFWKGEMGNALRDIQSEFDTRLGQISATLESKYNAQLTQISSNVNRDTAEINFIKEESKKFKNKITDLNNQILLLTSQNASLEQRNRQLEEMLREKDGELNDQQNKYEAEMSSMQTRSNLLVGELDKLMDAKMSLDLEITAYRKLVESEESRFDVKSKFESLGGIASSSESAMQSMVRGGASFGGQQQESGDKTEYTGRVTINRTSRAGLSFSDIKSDGSCITLSNQPTTYSKRHQNYSLKGWTILREFKNGNRLTYTFPDGFDLEPNSTISLYSRIFKGSLNADLNEKQVNLETWGTEVADTYLKDASGAEKATYKHVVHN